jgi:hypothetical protein
MSRHVRFLFASGYTGYIHNQIQRSANTGDTQLRIHRRYEYTGVTLHNSGYTGDTRLNYSTKVRLLKRYRAQDTQEV